MDTKTALHIQDIVQETLDTITIHFAQPEQELKYLSGQFLTLISEIESQEVRRPYSICSSPATDKNLSVTVKRITGGKMSNYLHNNVKVGDTINVLPPSGYFNYKSRNTARHIVLIGGGSGITPLFSIIKSALMGESASTVSLIYVNTSKKTTILYKQLEEWSSKFSTRFNIFYYWSDVMRNLKPKPGLLSRIFRKEELNTHRINAALLKIIFNDLQIKINTDVEFYICGPQGLMEMTTATIQKMGFPKEHIHKESFYSATMCRSSEAVRDYQIKLLLKGKEYDINVPASTPILFAALELGIDIPFACQSGNCVSCAGKCLSGDVEMVETDGLTEEQIQDGFVLTCVGYPTSDNVVIEFK